MRPKTGMHNGENKDAPERHCQSRTMIDSEEEKNRRLSLSEWGLWLTVGQKHKFNHKTTSKINFEFIHKIPQPTNDI